MNTTYGCLELNPENYTNIDIYEANYNGRDSNNRARANWRDFEADLECMDDSYFCGLNMFMDGKFRQKSEQNFELFDNNKNEFTTEEKLKGRKTIGKKDYIQ